MRLNLKFLLNFHKQRKSWKKTQIQSIISCIILSASQMLILNLSRYKREGTEEKQLSLLDKREYPQGEGVWMNTASKSFKLLRPDGHLLLSKRRSLYRPKLLIYTFSLFEEGVPAGGGRCLLPYCNDHSTREKPLRLQKLSFLMDLAKLGTPLIISKLCCARCKCK